jgi:hypothetical protein
VSSSNPTGRERMGKRRLDQRIQRRGKYRTLQWAKALFMELVLAVYAGWNETILHETGSQEDSGLERQIEIVEPGSPK